MASLRKRGGSYQLIFTNPITRKREYLTLPKGLSEPDRHALKKDIELKIARHKARLEQFSLETERVDHLTLLELTECVCSHTVRLQDVGRETIERNRYAMKLFMEVVGSFLPTSTLIKEHIDQFKADV